MKKVIIIVPNYQAGKDAAAGFKHKFGGEILDEIYVPLGQLDYSAELTRIAAANPDAIFAFTPGGMGVRSFQVRQQPLPDPGLLPHESRQTPGRQISDGDRQKGVHKLRQLIREGLPDEIADERPSGISATCFAFAAPLENGRRRHTRR